MKARNALAFIREMNADQKLIARNGIIGKIKKAIAEEVVNRMAEAIQIARDLGLSDGEVIKLTEQALRRQRSLERAIKYRASSHARGLKDKSN